VVSPAQLIERMDSLLHRAAGDAIEIRFAIGTTCGTPWSIRTSSKTCCSTS
jgi:hypothetical protein